MNTAILLIGGNLGDRISNLSKAVQLIAQKAGPVTKISALYQTAPWGAVDQPDYLNQALMIETSLDALTLLHTLLDIEREIGRIRQEKYGARVIDIDLIFYNQDILNLPDLKVPHPRLHLRNFVLIPLLEIIPDFQHPVLKTTIKRLAADCADTLPVTRVEP